MLKTSGEDRQPSQRLISNECNDSVIVERFGGVVSSFVSRIHHESTTSSDGHQ